MNTPDFLPLNSYIQPEPETDDEREHWQQTEPEWPPCAPWSLAIAVLIVGASALASLAWPNWIILP